MTDANWHLYVELERTWPMLVHGPFLWGGRQLRPSWACKQRAWLEQLEDGEAVRAERVYACANADVAPYLRRLDAVYVAVDTDGHDTLGETLRHRLRGEEGGADPRRI